MGGKKNMALSAMISVLAQINALPAPKRKPALMDRNAEIAAQNDIFNVCRHIVFAFQYMLIESRIVRSQFIKKRLQIRSDIGAGIFTDTK